MSIPCLPAGLHAASLPKALKREAGRPVRPIKNNKKHK